ncbi:hypothetical protein CC1G_05583 [Coprinopsis cinerea okayama7|uniref:Uncharacterized protein n=1 Tax=Coprinopsis cinerea (strain Okayama-7 / 130 / ATCC MYA-4618 / FGSC 9003) TaxID=240176 RepID=A8P1I2_COPC7|nr:hypothetical protein CC1G_05583 [Coprinopsis cinerea okayama7\|eukprot:XP_001838102.2 hypothetical protein CC1G_05583 [Coprinopsis cinerea okayama7\
MSKGRHMPRSELLYKRLSTIWPIEGDSIPRHDFNQAMSRTYRYQLPRNWDNKPIKGRLPFGKEGDVYLDGRRETMYRKEISLHDGWEDFDEAEFFESLDGGGGRRERCMAYSLGDIPMRPAKAKGIRREYELVDGVPEVLVLDDEIDSTQSENDWEEIHVVTEVDKSNNKGERQLYSSVVKGGSTTKHIADGGSPRETSG